MGKKYIIELEDKPFHKEDGDFLYRVKGFNSLVFDMTGIGKLTPYTEPDLGQVRKKAYKIGYEKGYRDGVNRIGDAEDKIRKEAYDKGYDDAKGGYENGFENGMIVAWDAARKIIRMPEVDLLNLFTECYSAVCTSLQVFLKYDASECIEKIRQYEQKQEMDGLRQNIQTIVDQCGYTLEEIAEVLKEMRDDGNRIQETMSDDY